MGGLPAGVKAARGAAAGDRRAPASSAQI